MYIYIYMFVYTFEGYPDIPKTRGGIFGKHITGVINGLIDLGRLRNEGVQNGWMVGDGLV